MYTTSHSLLECLRHSGNPQAWRRFTELYTPLLYHWGRGLGLQFHDAADLAQEVFTVAVRKLPEFTYDHNRSFRGWLYTILLNKWRDRQRGRAAQPPLPLPPVQELVVPDPLEELHEREHRRAVLRRVLQNVEGEFQPSTWKACWECLVEGRSAAEVAAACGLTVGAVYVAKSRVLARLRHELRDLLD